MNDQGKEASFFDVMLFDVLYLIMNCDFEVDNRESEFIEEALTGFDANARTMFEARIKRLDGIIGQGFEEIRKTIEETAKQFNIFPHQAR